MSSAHPTVEDDYASLVAGALWLACLLTVTEGQIADGAVDKPIGRFATVWQ